MKIRIPLFLIAIFIAKFAFSQGVAISQSGNPPHPSSALDIDFNNRGVLFPRLTQSQRDSIQNPAVGLLILNLNTGCLNMYLAGGWKQACFECDFGQISVSSNEPVCTGDTLQLTCSTVAGATYSWTGPNGFSSNLQNPIIPNVSTSSSGTYSVIVTLSGCSSSPVSTAISILPRPNPLNPISNSPVCDGDSLIFSLTPSLGATYTWYGPNGFSSTSTNPVVYPASSLNTGTYSVYAELNGCYSDTPSIAATIINSPPVANAGPDQYFQCGGIAVLQGSDPGSGTGVWSVLPNTGSLSNPNDSAAIFSGVFGESYTLRWTVSNLCDTTFDEVNIVFGALPSSLISGLVSYYPFCGNADDESGGTADGSLVNGASLTSDRNGNANRAVDFDGVNDYMTTTNASVKNLTLHSVSMWVKREGTGNNFPRLFLNGDVNTGIVITQSDVSSDILYRVKNAVNCDFVSTGNPLANNWDHYVFTFDGSTFRIYKNGTIYGSGGSCSNPNPASGNLAYYGGDSANSAFNGKLDDIAIWSRVLSATEVSDLYNYLLNAGN